MDNETEIIKKYVKNLPQEMRDYLSKNIWQQKLGLIASANKLSEEQAYDLKTEVMLVLIGIENYVDLGANIQKNIRGASYDTTVSIVRNINTEIFSEVKSILVEIEKANKEAVEIADKSLSKEEVLNDIENPVPAKPAFSKPPIVNPAGKNPILDAQHNLPEGEKRPLISSAAVPSRGPMLSNFKNNFNAQPIIPKTVTQTPPATQPKPIVTPKPLTLPTQTQTYPFSQPQQSQRPKPSQATQPQKLSQTPIPPAPEKYTVDPYREPAE